MPVISRFLGIAISILYDDHDPPHFHATYGGQRISVRIHDGVVLGRFPRRAQALVLAQQVQPAQFLVKGSCAGRTGNDPGGEEVVHRGGEKKVPPSIQVAVFRRASKAALLPRWPRLSCIRSTFISAGLNSNTFTSGERV